MTRDDILNQLRLAKADLKARFGVVSLGLFGSYARDTATDASDLDILVTFDGPATSERYFGVQFHLEDLFGRPIDLVTRKALRPEFRAFVERQVIDV
jgi:predicted nucleotidyltransferase